MNRRPVHRLLMISLLSAALMVPGPVWTQDKKPPKPEAAAGGNLFQSDSPLTIVSDRMEVDQNARTILFEGHVMVTQDDLTITGKRMKVFGAAEQKELSAEAPMIEKIDRIEVEGEVKISQRDRVATSERAVYYHQEKKIVLSGQPVVAQGQDRVQGRLITLYTEQGKSVVEGGKETPVQAVLHPSRKETR